MLKNKAVEIDNKQYIIVGLDAISSISVMPSFQRVADAFSKISTGERSISSAAELKEDLELLLLKSSLLKEVYDTSGNGNPLARFVTHVSQLPTEISFIGALIQEVGSHIFGYDMPEDPEVDKKSRRK